MDLDLEDIVGGVPWPRVAAVAALVVCGGSAVLSGVGLALTATSQESALADLDAQIEQAKSDRDQAVSDEQAAASLVGSTDKSATATCSAIAAAQSTAVSSAYASASAESAAKVADAMSSLVAEGTSTVSWATRVSAKSDAQPTWTFLSSTAFDSTVDSLDVCWQLADSKTGAVYGWALGTYDAKTQLASDIVVYSTKAGRECALLSFPDGTREIDESLGIKSLLGVA